MSQFTVSLSLPSYLDQWLRNEYWDAEESRVVFPRGSAPRAVLYTVLRRAPRGWRPDPGIDGLPIEVPTFKGLNPATHNWLSPAGQRALAGACKKLFQTNLFNELSPLFDHDVCITDVIFDFMDRHGIEPNEKNWETIRQMYSRMRKKNQTEQC